MRTKHNPFYYYTIHNLHDSKQLMHLSIGNKMKVSNINFARLQDAFFKCQIIWRGDQVSVDRILTRT